MIKRQRKIHSIDDTAKKRPVLPVPRTEWFGGVPRSKKQFVTMNDVAIKPKRVFTKPELQKSDLSVLSDLSVVSNPAVTELIPETDTVLKPSVIRQPFISSLLIRQKARIKLLPQAATIFKLTALALFFMIVTIPAMSAYEAHIVNVTAELKEITPPTLTPPGSSVAWDNTDGGSGLSGSVNVVMTDSYPDATDIYYTYQTGTLVSGLVPDPMCGQTGPNGGGGNISLPQQLTINADTVIKAIACDGTSSSSDKSYINTKIYSFGQPVNNLVINEFLPNPTGTAAGNQGVSSGHTSGNGGEWVELFNNGTSTIDTDGFVLYDNFVPSSTPTSFTWTTTSDFNSIPAPVNNNTVVSGGSVMMLATQTSGTFEKVFDIGTNKQATWGSLSLGSSMTDPAASICPAVATSDDGVAYTPYVNLSPCATATSTSISTSLGSLPSSRFLKWKATFTRVNTSTMVNLNSLTINYNFVDYNTYHELVITTENSVNSSTPGSTIMPPGDFLVVYRDGNPNFDLNSQNNSVSLYDGHLYLGAALIDSHSYSFDSPIPVNHSIARIPDGSSNWVDPCPTPGSPNVATCVDPLLFADSSATSTATSTLDVLLTNGDASSTVGDATTTVDSTTTPGNITGGGSDGGSAGSPPGTGGVPSAAGGGGSVDATTTPDPTPTPTVTPTPTPTPDTSTTTVSSGDSVVTPTPTPIDTVTPTPSPTPTDITTSSSDSNPSDQTPIAPTTDSTDSSGSTKQPDAITPPQPDQSPAITPTPTSSGDGSPPPDPSTGN